MTNKDSVGIAFIIVWVLALLLGLAFWGTVAWAVIELVQWVTAK